MRSVSAHPKAGVTGVPDKASEDLTDEPRKRTSLDIAGIKSEKLSGKHHTAGIKPGPQLFSKPYRRLAPVLDDPAGLFFRRLHRPPELPPSLPPAVTIRAPYLWIVGMQPPEEVRFLRLHVRQPAAHAR